MAHLIPGSLQVGGRRGFFARYISEFYQKEVEENDEGSGHQELLLLLSLPDLARVFLWYLHYYSFQPVFYSGEIMWLAKEYLVLQAGAGFKSLNCQINAQPLTQSCLPLKKFNAMLLSFLVHTMGKIIRIHLPPQSMTTSRPVWWSHEQTKLWCSPAQLPQVHKVEQPLDPWRATFSICRPKLPRSGQK